MLENISASSPYIPRFNNQGKFKFDVIQKIYDNSEENIRIEESDCIKWSYLRTKIENVHTEIEFKYKWNYASKEFDKSIVKDISDLNQFDTYDRNYYGFPEDDGNPDYNPNAESTLVIDDDRGKYIRDDETAEKYLIWMLYWSCNQHLKMKVKLPIKYLGIEIGSLLTFDNVLGDVKPYGIDYKYDSSQDGYYGSIINGQQVFSTFLCISTNKTLEFVEVECIQLHNLHDEMIPFDAITGIMDETAWNYNPSATFNYGTPVYASNFIQGGCPFYNHPMIEGEASSENYVGSELAEQENVFNVSDIDSSALDVNGDVYNYWNNGGTPIVFLGTNCIWQDITLHEIESVLIKDSNGVLLGTSIMSNGEFSPLEISVSGTTFLGQIEFIFKNNPLPSFSGDNKKFEVSHIPQNTFDNFNIETNNKLIYESFTFEVAEGGNNINMKCIVGSDIAEFNVNLPLQSNAFHPYDFNQDGYVNFDDFDTLLFHVSAGLPYDAQYDLTGDGTLDTMDVLALANFIVAHPELTGDQ